MLYYRLGIELREEKVGLFILLALLYTLISRSFYLVLEYSNY
jgi:hypothetical protein